MNRKYYLIIIIIIICFCLGFYLLQKDMLLLQANPVIEINEQFQYKKYITAVKRGTKSDVSCYQQQLDTSQTGQYEVVFVYRDKEYPVIVEVADTIAPEITVTGELTVLLDSQPDLMKGLSIKDNSQQELRLSIDATKLNMKQEGEYQIAYYAYDLSGNEAVASRTVKVVKEYGSALPSQEKTVYLTFDDGPSQNTKAILDILKQYEVPATFFVTGSHQQYNQYIQEAYSQGHTIGLHSYCHEYDEIYCSTDAYFQDLDKVGKMVEELIGFVPHYIRFPGGSSNKISSRYQKGIMTVLTKEVLRQGYQYYDWNCSLGDAEGHNIPASQLIQNATESHDTNIVLLAHDTDEKDTTVEALSSIIEYYLQQGYQFRAIDDDSYYAHQSLHN